MNTQNLTKPLATDQRRAAAAAAPAMDYEQVVAQFYEALYRFAWGLTGNESDAADLTQDTCHVLLIRGGEIRDRRKVKSWLFTTLYRQFLGRRRQAARWFTAPVETVEWELPVLAPRLTDQVDGALAVAALRGLDESYRAPLALFYLEDLSYQEIAAALNLPIGTVMSRLSRGKEILRQRLGAPSPVAGKGGRAAAGQWSMAT